MKINYNNNAMIELEHAHKNLPPTIHGEEMERISRLSDIALDNGGPEKRIQEIFRDFHNRYLQSKPQELKDVSSPSFTILNFIISSKNKEITIKTMSNICTYVRQAIKEDAPIAHLDYLFYKALDQCMKERTLDAATDQLTDEVAFEIECKKAIEEEKRLHNKS